MIEELQDRTNFIVDHYRNDLIESKIEPTTAIMNIFYRYKTDMVLFCHNYIRARDRQQLEISRTITKDMRYKVLKRQKWKCNLCNCTLKWNKDSDWSGKVGHIDHIHPYSKRDSYINGIEKINELSNLQALCETCNLKKSSKEIQ